MSSLYPQVPEISLFLLEVLLKNFDFGAKFNWIGIRNHNPGHGDYQTEDPRRAKYWHTYVGTQIEFSTNEEEQNKEKSENSKQS